MFINLRKKSSMGRLLEMVGKHKCSEKRHRNNYHNLELGCEHCRSGWSNEQHQATRAVVSDCGESAVAADF